MDEEQLQKEMDLAIGQLASPVPQLVADPRDRQPEHLSIRHEALIDFIIANPAMSQEQIGAHFGYKQGYVSKLINSGLFRAKLAERRKEFFSIATQTNREKLEELSSAVLDRLLQKVEVEQDTARLAKVAELALRAAGYGDSPRAAQQPQQVQNNVYFLQPVQREILAQARAAGAKRFVEPQLIDATQDAQAAK